MVDRYLGPLAKAAVGPLPVDGMMSHSALELWRAYDPALKKVYAHYATLDLLSPERITWKAVSDRNSAVRAHELALMMTNFEVGGNAY